MENDQPVDLSHQETQPTESVAPPAAGSPKKEKGSKKKTIFVIILAVIVIAFLAGAGWFIFSDPSSEGSTGPESSITTVPTKTPTATVVPTTKPLVRKDVNILLWNGTGVPKEASLLGEKLEELGYEELTLENAGDQDGELEVTVVVFSKSLSTDAVDEITELLEDTYKEVNVKSGSIGEYDVKITTGLRQGQTAPSPTEVPEETPTPTPEEEETTPTPTP